MRAEKAQTAVEFLTSNSGAVVLILLLVVLLFYIGISNSSFKQQSCSFEGFFSCHSYKIDSSAGLALETGQATGGSVIVYAISCTSSPEGLPVFQALSNAVFIPHGDYRYIAGGNSGNIIHCGAPERGDSFRQKICLVYSAVDFRVNHTACGNLATRVE